MPPRPRPIAADTAASMASSERQRGIPANMQINQTDFLQLISTQLQNQDPMQPTDPDQFLAQLEGLSEVIGLQSMQTAMQSVEPMSASQVLSGASLLGQSVLAPGTTASAGRRRLDRRRGQRARRRHQLSRCQMTDSSGAPVTSFQVTPARSGMTAFSWNGATSTGTAAPAGQYTISVNATVDGTPDRRSPMVGQQVQSVTIDPTHPAAGSEYQQRHRAAQLRRPCTEYH